jgi:hypothetical protein
LSQKRKRNECTNNRIKANGPVPIVLNQLLQLNQGSLNNGNDDNDGDEAESVSLASALSRAMGRANVLLSEGSNINVRILVILASMDYSSYYVPLMNTIFSAEHLNVRIDCLNVCQSRSKFMEQAVNQTNGVYQHLDGERGHERAGK